ncbi:pyridoxine 5'-phosphate synthase [Rubritepida flocculans]|uniref:pyridoxine 5'-phosphate synthase n=1 Tax=Rubritepida flocculans TaxID=182403 RepID=UPI0004146F69|nr:pyridoxine 5'-phosphate synthase [Rubritepida flocculans]
MRLSVNIDHVATLRNARGGAHPCPVAMAQLCLDAGAEGITFHLREDRRHIRDADVRRLHAELRTRLNFEMAATPEMVGIAESLARSPRGLAACCFVPEKREELTTEGGLDVLRAGPFLAEAIARMAAQGTEVSLFVEPDAAQIEAAARLGAKAVELHTGSYADAAPEARPALVARLAEGARVAAGLGLAVHAGHGLSFETIGPVAAIPEICEVSIGHFLVGAALAEGFPGAVARMRGLIRTARGG